MLAHACGVEHPTLIGADRIELLDGQMSSRTAAEVFGYKSGWGVPDAETVAGLRAVLGPPAPEHVPGTHQVRR
jgi:hypothetical protein